MITRDRNVVTVEGGVQGEVIAMSLEETAFDHVMEQLTRLYSDPIMAFIREVSTNADDARIEARSGKPTEVTLPSKLNPLFMVRDYGTGMDHDTIVYIYSRYGASTKRESNDYNGALGFGCKAPLAYTPQFTVVTVKDGLRNVISCARKPSGGGNMTLAEKNVATDEPNGTTVMVPVKAEDVEGVRERAHKFYRYWKPGTVKIDGDEPERVAPHMRLSSHFAVVKADADRILMANVAYPTPHRLDTGLRHGYSLLAEVPTGDVDFVGSREALETTAHTRATLAKVVQEFKAACKGAVQAKVDEAKTDHEAVQAMSYWRNVLPAEARNFVTVKDPAQPNGERSARQVEQYTYKGAILPAAWTEARAAGEWPFLVSPIRSYVASRHDTTEHIPAAAFARDVFVLGFTPKLSSNHKRRLNLWREDGHEDQTTGAEDYIFVRADAIPPELVRWIDPKRVVRWEDVKADYKLPVVRNSGGYSSGGWKVLKGSYENVWTEKGALPGETPASAIRQDKPIYFFRTRRYNLFNAIPLLVDAHPEYTVVKLQENRVDKFCRDFPNAKPVLDGLAAAYDVWRPKVTPAMLRARTFKSNLDYRTTTLLNALDADKLKDPALKGAIAMVKMDLTRLDGPDRVYTSLLHKGALPAGKNVPGNPFRSYPLVTRDLNPHDAPTLAHLILYVNMVYTANNA